jgi:hypothetical protein
VAGHEFGNLVNAAAVAEPPALALFRGTILFPKRFHRRIPGRLKVHIEE